MRKDNKRELLALDMTPSENSSIWTDILKEMKNKRGVKEITLFVSDNFPGAFDAISQVYPKAKWQNCVVHFMRDILKRISHKDKKQVSQDLKDLFDNFDAKASKENVLKKANKLVDKWEGKYPFLKKKLSEESLLPTLTYLEFHPDIRRLIYTTNSLENLNRAIRKATKNKLSFESPERLLDYVFMVIKEFEEKNYMCYPVHMYKKFSLVKEDSDTIF